MYYLINVWFAFVLAESSDRPWQWSSGFWPRCVSYRISFDKKTCGALERGVLGGANAPKKCHNLLSKPPKIVMKTCVYPPQILNPGVPEHTWRLGTPNLLKMRYFQKKLVKSYFFCLFMANFFECWRLLIGWVIWAHCSPESNLVKWNVPEKPTTDSESP